MNDDIGLTIRSTRILIDQYHMLTFEITNEPRSGLDHYGSSCHNQYLRIHDLSQGSIDILFIQRFFI